MGSNWKVPDEELPLPFVTTYAAPELGTVATVAESDDEAVCELTLIWGAEGEDIDRTLMRSPLSAHRIAREHATEFGGPVASDAMIHVWGS